MIGDEFTSSMTVVHKSDTLEVKAVYLHAGRLLPGSTLVFELMPWYADSWITRADQVEVRSWGRSPDIRLFLILSCHFMAAASQPRSCMYVAPSIATKGSSEDRRHLWWSFSGNIGLRYPGQIIISCAFMAQGMVEIDGNYRMSNDKRREQCVYWVKNDNPQVMLGWPNMCFRKSMKTKHLVVVRRCFQDMTPTDDPALWWSAGWAIWVLMKVMDSHLRFSILPGSTAKKSHQITWVEKTLIYERMRLEKVIEKFLNFVLDGF